MATSNSTNVNISNLPQAQIINNGDLLILQTVDGTQIIDFKNVNFVKTDLFGNALVSGNLSGANLFIVSAQATSISAVNYSSQGIPGIVALPGYYNNFTVTNGLVTSATYVQGSPEYINLTQTFIPAVTSYQTTIYSNITSGLVRIADQSGTAIIGAGTSNSSVTINNFFNNYPISVANITPAHFTVAATANIGTIPYVSNIQNVGQNLTFQVNLGGSTITSQSICWRLLITF